MSDYVVRDVMNIIKYVGEVLIMRKICKRGAEYEKNHSRVVLKVRKFCSRYDEKEKFIQELYWMWKNYLWDALNVRKLSKRCAEYA